MTNSNKNGFHRVDLPQNIPFFVEGDTVKRHDGCAKSMAEIRRIFGFSVRIEIQISKARNRRKKSVLE